MSQKTQKRRNNDARNMMRKLTLLLTITLLSGCGLVNYHTEVYVNGEKKAELKSNIPAKAKVNDIEIDQRGESWWEKVMPKNVKIEQ